MTAYRLLRPALFALPPETAHRAALMALRAGLVPAPGVADDPILAIDLWGRRFANPVGLAAGFDKDAVAIGPLLRLGFGFVEIGSVTPQPQPGNPRPRLFRLPAQEALINRLGFNNAGHAAARRRLLAWRRSRRPEPGLAGVNVGRNRDSADAAADYAAGVATFADVADYLVLNVSSPNTPGLRDLQGRAALAELLRRVLDARAAARRHPPLLIKIAPDLDEAALADVAAVALDAGIDGLIVSNTTTARPAGLPPRLAAEAGGLSGRPLRAPSTAALRRIARLTAGRLPLIGTGGVASGADAYAKIRAGASLVQLYTALVFQGPGLVGAIKHDLARRLRDDGFGALAEAVGCDLGHNGEP